MRGKRALAAACCVGVLALSGCGVRPSGVIDAGPAPTVQPFEVDVYLLLGANGQLAPVRYDRVPVTAERVLAALLTGSFGTSSRPNLHSEVPIVTDPDRLAQLRYTERAGQPVVELPFDVRELSPRAQDQVVCTAQSAVRATGGPLAVQGVRLSGGGGELPERTCARLY